MWCAYWAQRQCLHTYTDREIRNYFTIYGNALQVVLRFVPVALSTTLALVSSLHYQSCTSKHIPSYREIATLPASGTTDYRR